MTPRPDWANALKQALSGLAEGKPRPLLPILASFAGIPVEAKELVAFIVSAEENDPALTQLRLTLAHWDASDDLEFLGGDGLIAPIHTHARRRVVYDAMQLDDEVADALGARVPVFEKPAIVISTRFVPWYAEARERRLNVYWDDYERYLRDTKKWPGDAIASLDRTTTEVIERLSDPTRIHPKRTKGLVVGYVQSGKTANFTGVVAKAIDAGYRLIVVLTGTIEILRAQTQRRIDMELIGEENILAGQDPADPEVAKELDYQQDRDWRAGKFVRHGGAQNLEGFSRVYRVTTHRKDYERRKQGLSIMRFHRREPHKPLYAEVNLFGLDTYVAVVKKVKAPLEKLIRDLKPLKGDLDHLPVLIIDDESDQASVDTTNPAKWNRDSADGRKRTSINRLITQILEICPRAQYVGYTATPFANVFVDPDDELDLFPADFVLSLHRPHGYMGIQEFHDVGKSWDEETRTVANSNELAHVRPLKGDSDDRPEGSRLELQGAVDAWVLTGAIKKYRESHSAMVFRHHTMLVHETSKIAEMKAVADALRALWLTSRFTSAQGLFRLRTLYETDFLPVMMARADGQVVPDSFDELKPYIAVAFSEMTRDGDPVLVVNSDKEIQKRQKQLDFEKESVWRILVGGTKLSRGFTIEGLTVSFFRRRAGQADTLMQAGRWFGFRPGYRDLVRLYIRRDEDVDLYEAFEALLLDEEAFRDELRQYEGLDANGEPFVLPRQIPPLVSQHLPWLRPTARNKMWNAVIEAKATAGGIQDRYGLQPQGHLDNMHNLLQVGIPLLMHARDIVQLDYTLPDGASGFVGVKMGLVDATTFRDLFKQLRWHPQYNEVIEPFNAFVARATANGRISEWVVVWPQPVQSATVTLGGLSDAPVIRRSRRSGRIDFVGSDRKHSTAALPIAHGKSVGGLAGASGRGVVLIYLADDRIANSDEPLSISNVVPLLSVAVPLSATPHRRDLIQWTVRVKAKPDDITVPVGEHAEFKTLDCE